MTPEEWEEFFQDAHEVGVGADGPVFTGEENEGLLGDAWTSVKHAGLDVLRGAVGLADIPTGGAATQAVGDTLNSWDEALNREYSPETQMAQLQRSRAVDAAEGEWNKGWTSVKETLANPRLLMTEGIRTLGPTAAPVGGAFALAKWSGNATRAGALAQKGSAVRSAIAGVTPQELRELAATRLGNQVRAKVGRRAAIAGEGLMGAGLTANQMVSENIEEGRDPSTGLYAAPLVGIATSAIAGGASRFIPHAGYEGTIAGGRRAMNVASQKGEELVSGTGKPQSLLGRTWGGTKNLGKAFLGEGAEEAAQGVFETAIPNYALDKPIEEGMGENVGQSALMGGLMGAGMHTATIPARWGNDKGLKFSAKGNTVEEQREQLDAPGKVAVAQTAVNTQMNGTIVTPATVGQPPQGEQFIQGEQPAQTSEASAQASTGNTEEDQIITNVLDQIEAEEQEKRLTQESQQNKEASVRNKQERKQRAAEKQASEDRTDEIRRGYFSYSSFPDAATGSKKGRTLEEKDIEEFRDHPYAEKQGLANAADEAYEMTRDSEGKARLPKGDAKALVKAVTGWMNGLLQEDGTRAPLKDNAQFAKFADERAENWINSKDKVKARQARFYKYIAEKLKNPKASTAELKKSVNDWATPHETTPEDGALLMSKYRFSNAPNKATQQRWNKAKKLAGNADADNLVTSLLDRLRDEDASAPVKARDGNGVIDIASHILEQVDKHKGEGIKNVRDFLAQTASVGVNEIAPESVRKIESALEDIGIPATTIHGVAKNFVKKAGIGKTQPAPKSTAQSAEQKQGDKPTESSAQDDPYNSLGIMFAPRIIHDENKKVELTTEDKEELRRTTGNSFEGSEVEALLNEANETDDTTNDVDEVTTGLKVTSRPEESWDVTEEDPEAGPSGSGHQVWSEEPLDMRSAKGLIDRFRIAIAKAMKDVGFRVDESKRETRNLDGSLTGKEEEIPYAPENAREFIEKAGKMKEVQDKFAKHIPSLFVDLCQILYDRIQSTPLSAWDAKYGVADYIGDMYTIVQSNLAMINAGSERSPFTQLMQELYLMANSTLRSNVEMDVNGKRYNTEAKRAKEAMLSRLRGFVAVKTKPTVKKDENGKVIDNGAAQRRNTDAFEAARAQAILNARAFLTAKQNKTTYSIDDPKIIAEAKDRGMTPDEVLTEKLGRVRDDVLSSEKEREGFVDYAVDKVKEGDKESSNREFFDRRDGRRLNLRENEEMHKKVQELTKNDAGTTGRRRYVKGSDASKLGQTLVRTVLNNTFYPVFLRKGEKLRWFNSVKAAVGDVSRTFIGDIIGYTERITSPFSQGIQGIRSFVNQFVADPNYVEKNYGHIKRAELQPYKQRLAKTQNAMRSHLMSSIARDPELFYHAYRMGLKKIMYALIDPDKGRRTVNVGDFDKAVREYVEAAALTPTRKVEVNSKLDEIKEFALRRIQTEEAGMGDPTKRVNLPGSGTMTEAQRQAAEDTLNKHPAEEIKPEPEVNDVTPIKEIENARATNAHREAPRKELHEEGRKWFPNAMAASESAKTPLLVDPALEPFLDSPFKGKKLVADIMEEFTPDAVRVAKKISEGDYGYWVIKATRDLIGGAKTTADVRKRAEYKAAYYLLQKGGLNNLKAMHLKYLAEKLKHPSGGADNAMSRAKAWAEKAGRLNEAVKEGLEGKTDKGESIEDLIVKHPELKKAIGDAAFFAHMFHASPSKYDKVDFKYIGSGNGGDAHAWGLHLSSSVHRAAWYLKGFRNLMDYTPRNVTVNGHQADPKLFKAEADIARIMAITLHKNLGVDTVDQCPPKDIKAAAKKALQSFKHDEIAQRLLKSIIEHPENFSVHAEFLHAQLYEMSVPDEEFMMREEHELGWMDEKIREGILRAAKKAGIQTNWEMTGKDVYEALAHKLGRRKEASEALLDQGIKGMLYTGDKGIENAVVWDESSIEVIHRVADTQKLWDHLAEVAKKEKEDKAADLALEWVYNDNEWFSENNFEEVVSSKADPRAVSGALFITEEGVRGVGLPLDTAVQILREDNYNPEKLVGVFSKSTAKVLAEGVKRFDAHGWKLPSGVIVRDALRTDRPSKKGTFFRTDGSIAAKEISTGRKIDRISPGGVVSLQVQPFSYIADHAQLADLSEKAKAKLADVERHVAFHELLHATTKANGYKLSKEVGNALAALGNTDTAFLENLRNSLRERNSAGNGNAASELLEDIASHALAAYRNIETSQSINRETLKKYGKTDEEIDAFLRTRMGDEFFVSLFTYWDENTVGLRDEVGKIKGWETLAPYFEGVDNYVSSTHTLSGTHDNGGRHDANTEKEDLGPQGGVSNSNTSQRELLRADRPNGQGNENVQPVSEGSKSPENGNRGSTNVSSSDTTGSTGSSDGQGSGGKGSGSGEANSNLAVQRKGGKSSLPPQGNQGPSGDGSASRSVEVTAADKILESTPEKFRPVARTVINLFGGKGLMGMFTRNLVETFSSLVPSAKAWWHHVESMMQERSKLQQDAADVAERFSRLSKHEQERTNNLLRDSTINKFWAFRDKRVFRTDADWKRYLNSFDTKTFEEYKQFLRRFNGLTTAAKKSFMEVINAGTQEKLTLAEIQKQASYDSLGLRQKNMDAAQRKKLQEQHDAACARIDAQLEEALRNPYVSLGRQGDHVVTYRSTKYMAMVNAYEKYKAQLGEEGHVITDKERKALQRLKDRMDEIATNKDDYKVEFYESSLDANKRYYELKKLYPNNPEESIQTFDKAMYIGSQMPKWANFAEILRQISKSIEAENGTGSIKEEDLYRIAEAANEVYIQSLSDTSAKKAELRRRVIPGYNDNMLENYVQHAKKMSHLIASMNHSWDIHEALDAASKEAKNQAFAGKRDQATVVVNELRRRQGQIFAPNSSATTGKIMRTTSLWMLLTNPAFYLQNLLQPGMMSAPYINGQLGINCLGELVRTMKQVAELVTKDMTLRNLSKVLDKDEYAALMRARDRQLLTIGVTSELGEVGDNTALGKATNWLTRKAQTVEVINRVSTHLVAYRNAIAKGYSKEKAAAFAERTIEQTHGDYSKENAPSFFNMNAFTKTATQFRKFQFIQAGMVYRMLRDSARKDLSPAERAIARRQLMWIMGTHFAMAGLKGTPIVAQIMALTGLIAGMGGSGDDDEDLIRKTVKDKDMSDFLLKGIPMLLGVDLSKKVGAGDMMNPLPFFEYDATKGKRNAADLAYNLAGPWASIAGKLMEGTKFAFNGDYAKALEQVLPYGLLSNSVKAMRLEAEGYTNSAGDVLIKPQDMGLLSTLATAMGLTPREISARTTLQGSIIRHDSTFSQEKSRIQRVYSEAKANRDYKSMHEAIKALGELNRNRKNAGYTVIPRKQLDTTYTQKVNREANVRGGVVTTKQNRRFVEQMSRW